MACSRQRLLNTSQCRGQSHNKGLSSLKCLWSEVEKHRSVPVSVRVLERNRDNIYLLQQLAHVVMKSHDLLSESWQTRKASGIIQSDRKA